MSTISKTSVWLQEPAYIVGDKTNLKPTNVYPQNDESVEYVVKNILSYKKRTIYSDSLYCLDLVTNTARLTNIVMNASMMEEFEEQWESGESIITIQSNLSPDERMLVEAEYGLVPLFQHRNS